MNYWLMKSEPSVFSFEDLLKAPQRTTCWNGVRNYQARNLMRDQFKKGDRVLFYHSNVEEPHIAGIAEVVREGYPEKTAPWIMVDIRATHTLQHIVDRTMLKSKAALKNIMVLRRGSRLSVQPVTKGEFETILALGKPKTV